MQKQKLLWPRRPKREHTSAGYKRTWQSRCGKYRIQEMTPIGGLSKRYYALVLEDYMGRVQWLFVDPSQWRYRTWRAAERACQRHWRLAIHSK